MLTQADDTMGRDGPDASDAPATTRTLRSAVRSSSMPALAFAVLVALMAACTALGDAVPVASAATVGLLVAPCLVDVLDHRLPNRMVAAAGSVGVALAIIAFAAGGEVDVRGAALGAIAFAGPLLVMHLAVPTAMGFGDVKIAVVLGAAVGLIDPVYSMIALAVGSLFGAAAGLIGRRRTIAFGPALVGGALVSLVLAASSVDVVERTPEFVIERPSEVTTT